MKNFVFISGLIAGTLFTGFIAFMVASVEANVQEIKFDHSQCQYPLRTTNPANGCDNSDPCDPQDAVKGGSGECKAPEPVQQPAEPKNEPTEPAQPVSKPVKAEGCGK